MQGQNQKPQRKTEWMRTGEDFEELNPCVLTALVYRLVQAEDSQRCQHNLLEKNEHRKVPIYKIGYM